MVAEREADTSSPGGTRGETGQHVLVEAFAEDRSRLRELFEEAEDSAALLDEYLHQGWVIIARRGDSIVGHLQLVEGAAAGTVELKNMAVAASLRGAGVGRALVDAALSDARRRGYQTMTVATATADIGNLRFYQRCGFRLESVERDAFGVEAGYAEGLTIDGMPLRDRVWFSQPL